MPVPALLLASALYVWAAWGYGRQGAWGDAGAFLCYAGANVFFAYRPQINAFLTKLFS
jgi:hypothetical protein